MDRADQRLYERPADHRRRTRRAERHATSEAIHIFDPDDLDAVVSTRSRHDLGRPVAPASKPGRRDGFKVWKTAFWKRRTKLRRERALAERRLLEE